MEPQKEANINEAFVPPKGGYGRVFEAMYTGSMIGAGLEAFALMPYVISNMRIHPEKGAVVELNPVLLAFIFEGRSDEEAQKRVQVGIDKLCEEDPRSRNAAEGGRRLVRLGQFLYRVVNGEKYNAIRSKERDRLKNAEAQRRHRQKTKQLRPKVKSGPMPGETLAVRHGVTPHEHLNGEPEPGLQERAEEELDRPF